MDFDIKAGVLKKYVQALEQIKEEESGICAYTAQVVKGYQRITLTYKVINQATCITFIVSGHTKADILKKVLKQGSTKSQYPAARINPKYGKLQWYIDMAAARYL